MPKRLWSVWLFARSSFRHPKHIFVLRRIEPEYALALHRHKRSRIKPLLDLHMAVCKGECTRGPVTTRGQLAPLRVRPDGPCADDKFTTTNTVFVLVQKHEGLRWPWRNDIRHFPKDVIPTSVVTVAAASSFVHVLVHGNASDPRLCLPTDPNP